MMSEIYSDEEIRLSFEKHLQEIDDSELIIKKFRFYALLNRSKYDVFANAIQNCFEECAKSQDLKKQVAYIYLVNEIVQRETPNNIKLFIPLIEKMMIRAGETRDQAHIAKFKRVLSVLDERKIIDSKIIQRMNSLIDFNAKAGEDEDSNVANQFYSLTDELIQAKNNSKKMILNKRPDEELDAALQKERDIRSEITDFYSKQMNTQYAEIEKIDKQLDAKKKNDINRLVEGSDTSSDSDEAL